MPPTTIATSSVPSSTTSAPSCAPGWPRAGNAVLEITGHARLLEENPVLRRSIDVRNPYVDPINLLQVELLRRLRQAGRTAAARTIPMWSQLRRALLVTINGVAAGMRNTG